MNKLLCLCLLFSFSAMALEGSNFKILPGKFHSGGSFFASVKSTSDAKKTMTINLKYDIDKKTMIPVPKEYLKGEIEQDIPLEYLDERGYLSLEQTMTKDFSDAKAVYLGRVDVGIYKDAHHVNVIAKNGKSETELYYHPQAPGIGWVKVRMTIYPPLPILKNYTVVALLTK